MITSARHHFAWLLVWLSAIILVVWVLASVPLPSVLSTLGELSLYEVVILAIFNALLILSFAARWWLILRAKEHKIPYLQLAGYRLAAYSVSYLTPGPHFGGEPLQAYLASKRHNLPASDIVASVLVDKLLELIVNFSFLLVGVAITLQTYWLPDISFSLMAPVGLFLLAIPVSILVLLSNGHHPLSWLAAQMSLHKRWAGLATAIALIQASEDQAIYLCQAHGRMLIQAFVVSATVWLGLLLEYWLAASFLGVNLVFAQLIALVTVARLAILFPAPGGLGALEASQVMIARMLGLGMGFGVGLSLVIRARDIVFGFVGLWLGGLMLGGWRSLSERQTE